MAQLGLWALLGPSRAHEPVLGAGAVDRLEAVNRRVTGPDG